MLTEIDFPEDLKYSSDRYNKPLEFYLKCLRNSNSFDLRLGYFSSNAIRTLSLGFAQFIYNNGRVRIITNHYLSEKDKKLLEPETTNGYDYEYIQKTIEANPESLVDILSGTEQHFFDCLKYLINKDRLVIKPVKIKPDNLSHYKEGIFSDGENQIYFNGSCNFTYSGIIENGESIDIKRSWGASPERKSIINERKFLDRIFAEEDETLLYLEPEQIISVIKKKGLNKDLDELVEDEKNIFDSLSNHRALKQVLDNERKQFKLFIKEKYKSPRFPYPTGPYDYQIEAYQSWVKNNYNGIFAMATGTGKTITSLNCLLETFKETGYYRALILVPTIALVEQWKEEVNLFNFSKIFEVSGRTQWRRDLTRIKNDMLWGGDPDYIIISTYASFQNEQFLNIITEFPQDTLLIADEAHNIGATNTSKAITNLPFYKRIALSATPKRAYDPEGNRIIEKVFNDSPPYCYNYSMEKAIKNGVLSSYFYYPHLVYLQESEFERYSKITKQLIKYFNLDDSEIFSNDIVTSLLIKRKRIIHKAQNKLGVFRRIINELYENDKLRYCFIYVPEGYDYSENDKEPYYKIMMEIIADVNPNLRQSTFLGADPTREDKLRGFKEGLIDVLVAMKCLDEGVDVPRSEVGIFASSTGNPRQFIQRRGRLLRTHANKNYAHIYDLVVVPRIDSYRNNRDLYKLERSLFKKELTRVAYFANLSKNFSYSKNSFKRISEYFHLDLDSIIWELKDGSE